jgi:hypothetical protein
MAMVCSPARRYADGNDTMRSDPGRKRDPWLRPDHDGDPMKLLIAPTLVGKGGIFAPVRVKKLFAH